MSCLPVTIFKPWKSKRKSLTFGEIGITAQVLLMFHLVQVLLTKIGGVLQFVNKVQVNSRLQTVSPYRLHLIFNVYFIFLHCRHLLLFVFLYHLDIFTFHQDFVAVITVLGCKKTRILTYIQLFQLTLSDQSTKLQDKTARLCGIFYE